MSNSKLIEVTIIKPAFGEYSNATPVGKKTKVPVDIAELMKKSGHAK